MSDIPSIQPTELADDAVILDVREQSEYVAGHAPQAMHIPLSEVPDRVADLPKVDGALPVICRSGGRSGKAVELLRSQGHDVVNIEGGSQAWQAAGKPIVTDNGDEGIVL